MFTSDISTIRPELFTQRHRVQLEPYLEQVGLPEDFFTDPDFECSVRQMVELLEVAAKESGDINIGLRLGSQSLSTDFGVFGQAMRSMETIGELSKWGQEFSSVHQQSLTVTTEVNADNLILSYQISDPSIIERRQDTEFSVGFIFNMLREIAEQEPVLKRVDFEHSAPTDLSLHQAVFGCPVRFNQGTNRLIFSADTQHIPIKTRNRVLLQALQPYLEEQRKLRSDSSDYLTQINQIIAKQLHNGTITLPFVANAMSVSPRTIQRRLAAQGIQFADLVEDLRKSMALFYVKRGDSSLTEIALMLGYSETSSFSRAFKRWTSMSPRQYRQGGRE